MMRRSLALIHSASSISIACKSELTARLNSSLSCSSTDRDMLGDGLAQRPPTAFSSTSGSLTRTPSTFRSFSVIPNYLKKKRKSEMSITGVQDVVDSVLKYYPGHEAEGEVEEMLQVCVAYISFVRQHPVNSCSIL